MRLYACLLLCSLPSYAEAQEIATAFRDWSVACDAVGYCLATTPSSGGTLAPGSLELNVARHPRQPYWELSFSTRVGPPADQWADITISVDSEPQVFSLPVEFGAYGADSDIYLLGSGAQAVMDRLQPGATVTVVYTDLDRQRQQAAFSLSGLTAALLWIDERQGRIGSERVAFAPPHGLVPLDAGMVAPDIPLALLDRHRADPDCSAFEDLTNGRDFDVGALGDGKTVYLIPCQSGAYNFAHKVYVGSGEGTDTWYEPQFFADFGTDIGWTGTPYIWNGFFDEATRTLAGFAKSRGTGDCGSQGEWTWNGYLFVLVGMRARDCSDDLDPDGGIPEFSVVYEGDRTTLR